jgi:acyl-CoA reductase-like NAD-dependent aldehyde dehydrogenase
MNIREDQFGYLKEYGNFIDGGQVEAGSGALIDVRNPATGEIIARIPNSTAADVDRAMRSARAAFEGRAWAGMDTRIRARLVNRLADAFENHLEELYRLETLNNGRPINETRTQLSRILDYFRYNAGLVLARRDAVIPEKGLILIIRSERRLEWSPIALRSTIHCISYANRLRSYWRRDARPSSSRRNTRH